ncbi:alanine:cation symporter family protein [Actinobacteria bacterium YIM 96077]|uniref:Sodium:alanine symporter family protein n=1 Tax=Phytoactinopolyspora halophila TaxID=1981511 RepID=A0A329QFZ4_9ACTN|nr:alanine:cation symporter family protein [Actinobacteria bacterium YIM 96077]RAW10881.1 sodium:alanine symporter family protein [Phytoactinopolyspora halophila]
MEDIIGYIGEFVWGGLDIPVVEFGLLVPLLLGTGLFLTIMLRGVQFTKLFYSLWLALIKRKEEGALGDVSHYQALTVALAATVGVGNIAGVGSAIAVGGAGALFWMWVTGLVGMATKYSEAFLGVKYRRQDAAGEQSGGPMFYISEGLREKYGDGKMAALGKVLAILFAIFGALAAFGIGNGVQSGQVASTLDNEWGFPTWATGLVLMLVAALVILGGIKSIGRFTAAFVPFMAIFYLLGATVILLLNIADLPQAIATIFEGAFTGEAAAGGFLGAGILLVLRQGVARGIFSNESGLGTGGIAAAAAKTTHEVRQAMVSMTQTFLDTLVVVTFTGLVIVTTGMYTEVDDEGEQLQDAVLTAESFREGLPGDWGGTLVSLAVVFFAFSTLLGWAYYGERCMDRLFGRVAVTPYRVVFCLFILVGSVASLDLVWDIADILNGLMALPNLVGLILLAVTVRRTNIEFFSRPEWKLITVKPEAE